MSSAWRSWELCFWEIVFVWGGLLVQEVFICLDIGFCGSVV